MWFDDALFYQFYSLRICGAPLENTWDWSVWNGAAHPVNRISRIVEWIPHLQRLGVNAVYFSPVFQSDRHGYDTRDYYTVDSRLGSNEDFAAVCSALHHSGIRVVLDGVFNHVGRGFWAFLDVLKNKQQSKYTDWFHLNWNENSSRNDGFSYQGWEGIDDLVALNLENSDVQTHLFGAVRKWIELFTIDGIRLDVAYSLPLWFIKKLRSFTDELGREKGREIILIGEIIRDQYEYVGNDLLHSCTDYECFKGIYSSLNEMNLFEIAYSMNRLFSSGGLCVNKHLFNFVDNHDVTRIASKLRNPAHLFLAYGILFALPGTPCVYYGSEWGITGRKSDGDNALRPERAVPEWNSLTSRIEALGQARRKCKALRTGSYRQLCIMNGQFLFERKDSDGQRIIIALNAAADSCTIIPTEREYGHFDGLYGLFQDVLSGCMIEFDGKVTLQKESVMYLVPVLP